MRWDYLHEPGADRDDHNNEIKPSPYPSNIVVAGMPGTVTKVTVKLNNITHTNPVDMDMLLIGPAGQTAIIMSDAGGCCSWYH